MKLLIKAVFVISILSCLSANEVSLDKKISKLIVLGFDKTSLQKDDKIALMVKQGLGGVILFDKNLRTKQDFKNILSPKQLKKLTSDLQNLSKQKLLICIDEEGGRVARLREKRGFKEFKSPKEVSKLGLKNAQKTYSEMAKMLSELGINSNLSPSVDLIYDYNPVIAGLSRSFSKNPSEVAEYAKEFIDAHRTYGILTAIKHFPGHGSSKADSHNGFTDLTNTWQEKELIPFKTLIDTNEVDMVMTAHVFNKNLDKNYPATLSYNIITNLLRKKLSYKGVIISDDMQMGAIRENYSLKEAVTLSLNAGVDLLIFSNQFGDEITLDDIVSIIKQQIKDKKIKQSTIEDSYKRVCTLLDK